MSETRHLRALYLAVWTYVAALVPVTFVAVVFFGRAPAAILVPLEYLLPLWPAAIVYRRTRLAPPAADPGKICPACGYGLRATPDRCPACGALRPPPSTPAWVAPGRGAGVGYGIATLRVGTPRRDGGRLRARRAEPRPIRSRYSPNST